MGECFVSASNERQTRLRGSERLQLQKLKDRISLVVKMVGIVSAVTLFRSFEAVPSNREDS